MEKLLKKYKLMNRKIPDRYLKETTEEEFEQWCKFKNNDEVSIEKVAEELKNGTLGNFKK